MKKLIAQLIMRSALIIVGILGIIFTMFSAGTFMGDNKALYYFTVQSNITIIGITIVFLVDTIRQLFKKESFINQVLLKIKYVFTIAITITFLVFTVLLAPTLGIEYLLSYNNFSLHFIVPILAIVDFFLFDVDIKLNKFNCLLGLAMPVYYLFFFLLGILLKFRYIGDSVAPYYFLNYEELTWFSFTNKGPGVFYWMIIMLIGISTLCFIFYLFMRLRQKKRRE